MNELNEEIKNEENRQCNFAIMDEDLQRQATVMTAAECRATAEIFRRWAKQLEFKADMMTSHTITGMFVRGSMRN